MTRTSSTFSIVAAGVSALLLCSISVSVFAAEKGSKSDTKRFYYDQKTNRYFTDGKAAFSIRPSGDSRHLERIEVSINESNFVPYVDKLKLDKEGLHHIRFRAADPLLNWSPLQDFRIFVDLTAPDSQAYWIGPNANGSGTLFVSPLSTFNIRSLDALSGVAQIFIEQNGKATVYSGPISFKADGSYTVKYWALDNVGNQESQKDIKFTVDGKTPATTHTVEGQTFLSGDKLFVNSGTRIMLAAKDDSSGVADIEYQINGGVTSIYQGPIPISDTKTELKFRSSDRVGNKEPWKTYNVFQDTTPPRITIAKDGNFVLSGGRIFAAPGFTLTVSAADIESGVAELTAAKDGRSFEKPAGGRLTFKDPGEYHFLAKSSDRVGNASEADPYVVIIDNQPPVSQIRLTDRLVQKDGILYSAVPNKIEISAEDNSVGVDTVEISYDGKAFTPLSGSIDVSKWDSQKKTLWYRGVDRLKNREQAHSMVIQLKTEGPKVDLVIESESLPNVPLSTLRKEGKKE